MEVKKCEILEEVEKSEIAKEWLRQLKQKSKEFKGISLKSILSDVSIFHRAIHELLKTSSEIEGEVNRELINNVEKLIIEEQLKALCLNKNYKRKDLRHFLIKTLEIEGITMKEVEGIYEYIEMADPLAIIVIESKFNELMGTTQMIEGAMSKEYQNLIMALLAEKGECLRGKCHHDTDVEGIIEDKEFLKICETYSLVDSLAFYIESFFKEIKKGDIDSIHEQINQALQPLSLKKREDVLKIILGKLVTEDAVFNNNYDGYNRNTCKWTFKEANTKENN